VLKWKVGELENARHVYSTSMYVRVHVHMRTCASACVKYVSVY